MWTATGSRAVQATVAGLIRSTSATVFALQLVVIAVTAGGPSLATWRRLGLGWRAWDQLSELNTGLALASLAGWFLLSGLRASSGSPCLVNVRWCPSLNVATIVLALFIPKIAAL